MTITNAMAELTAAFEASPGVVANRVPGTTVVASWPSVPVEIIRAAGLSAVIVRGSAAATPIADVDLEEGVFPSRLRHLLDAALARRLTGAACIAIARTSDVDYKSFLYLREFARTGSALPPIVLFDLLQSRGPHIRAYVMGRMRAFVDALASISGHVPSDNDMRREITKSNAARAAARRLSALRGATPRISGTEAFPLLGAFWQMPPEPYAALAGAVAEQAAVRPVLNRPRVLLAGAPVDTPALHAAIESHGATVVAEVGPWGNDGTREDVRVDHNPIAALTDHYRDCSSGARLPADTLRTHTERLLEDVDAAVVSLPPDEAVFGWDYPALRDLLNARQVPHVCLRTDPYQPLGSADHAGLASLVAAATPLRTVRHG